MTVVCHSEALAEESMGALFRTSPLPSPIRRGDFHGSFAFAQDDDLRWKKAKMIVNKIIVGMRKISELIKFKNRVKIRILPANARKNIV